MEHVVESEMASENLALDRMIGSYTQAEDGPMFIALAGVHGNEAAGIKGLERVFTYLEKNKPAFKGIFYGVRGNLTALEANKRYIDVDLNRQWYPRKVEKIHQTPRHLLHCNEDQQQKDLLILFDYTKRNYYRQLKDERHKQVIMMDLHTFSAKGGAYSIATHLGKSKQFASLLQVPVIIGLENVLRGTTMHYFNDLEMVSYCFEGGQHFDPYSVDIMEAAIWVSLVGIGCIEQSEVANFEHYKAILNDIGQQLPQMVEFCYRHAVSEEDEFEMQPGYRNFQAIEKGELLAHDKYGPIYAAVEGLMLMPLYQKQGVDGFFIVREVK